MTKYLIQKVNKTGAVYEVMDDEPVYEVDVTPEVEALIVLIIGDKE